MDKKEKKSKIVEKIVLETPNDMELGKKIRELYRREVDSLENNQWDEYNRIVKEMNDMVKDLDRIDIRNTNLQPLWKEENLKKGARLDWE